MVIVANMIGTGVFTSLGFQVFGISSFWSILILWIIGGIVALTGALCYADLTTITTRSGGEYHLLSFLFGKPIGFMAGWISFTLGFAAPIAAVSVALGNYLSAALSLNNSVLTFISPPQLIALIVVSFVTLFQLFNRKMGAIFQNLFTTLKIGFIVFIIIVGFIMADFSLPQFHNNNRVMNDIFSNGFAVSIYFVLYAYSGWNAVVYFASEVKHPEKNIPRSIITGTIIVTSLYLCLNAAFMMVLPFSSVQGQPEVGFLFAEKVFGNFWGSIMGICISILLISSVSSMIIAGPRVSKVMGEDFKALSFLKQQNKHGIPQVPILIQYILTCIYILTMSFSYLITLVGFVLSLFTFLTVLCLLIYRMKNIHLQTKIRNLKVFVSGVVFIIVNLWVLYYGFYFKIIESLIGIGLSFTGLAIYYSIKNEKVN